MTLPKNRTPMNSTFGQQKISKPKTLACYICGRQFGTKSLTLHLKPCKEKFKIQQDQKIDKSLKIKLPNPPQLLETVLAQAQAGCLEEEILDQYNEEARNTHKYKVLPACKYCGRTFNEQSLASHMKACPKKASYVEPSDKDNGYKIQDDIKKPRTLVCCVCGRQLGLTSLKIHYPQCQEKFRNEELKKAPKQRNPTPQFSQEDLDLVNNKSDWTLEEIAEFNQKASANFRNKAMVQCQNCKRKFLPQSYKRHQKNCKLINGDKTGEKPGGGKSLSKPSEYPPINGNGSSNGSTGYDAKEFKKPKVLMCHICGRQFGLSSLKIHIKNCIEKFHNQELKRPKHERRPLPQMNIDMQEFDINFADKWSIQKIQEYNQAANEIYKGCSLFPCPICGRKFFEQSLKRHLNYCQKNAEDKKLKEEANQQIKERQLRTENKKLDPNLSKSQSNKSFVKSPQISNKKGTDELSTTSKTLNIKLPSVGRQAQEQANFNHTIKQVSQELQGTMNQRTKQLLLRSPSNKNQAVQQAPTENNSEQVSINRVECSKCNRKFTEDRIQKHEAICKGSTKKAQQIKEDKASQLLADQPHKKPQKRGELSPIKMSRSQFQQFKEQASPEKEASSQLEECPKCGKKFMPAKIQKHVSKCRDVAFRIKQKEQKKEEESFPPTEDQYVQISKPLTSTPLKKPSIVQKQLNTNKIFDRIKQQLRDSEQQQSSQPKLSQQPKQKQQGLTCCRYCNRKFDQQRIQKHQNVCLNKKEFQEKQKISERQSRKSRDTSVSRMSELQNKQVSINKLPLSQERQDQKIDLTPCPNCGRKFASERVEKHQQVCKGPTKKKQSITSKPGTKQSIQIEENQFLANQQKSPLNSQNNKKKIFNIKPVTKKSQEKKLLSNDQEQRPSQKQLIKQNLKITEDIMKQIWDTKQGQNNMQNASQALNKEKMVPGIPKPNKTSYDGGFYKRQQANSLEEDKQDLKLQEIDNLQRVKCQKCGRSFMEERIQKHEQICKGLKQIPVNSGQKRQFKRYAPQIKQKSSNKNIPQNQSSQIGSKVVIPESKDIIKTFKQLKNLKINQSYIDKELQKQLQGISPNKQLNEIKTGGFGARNTYGGGEKFYSRQSNKKLQDEQTGGLQNVSGQYPTKYLQPISQVYQNQKSPSNHANFTVKKRLVK